LAASGAEVALLDVNESDLETATASCRHFGVGAEYRICDVTDAGRVREVFEEILTRFGSIE
jgi:NAD(P)-dependent dehydrogenase (short-subunit alcohol dehydrogenase family)